MKPTQLISLFVSYYFSGGLLTVWSMIHYPRSLIGQLSFVLTIGLQNTFEILWLIGLFITLVHVTDYKVD